MDNLINNFINNDNKDIKIIFASLPNNHQFVYKDNQKLIFCLLCSKYFPLIKSYGCSKFSIEGYDPF